MWVYLQSWTWLAVWEGWYLLRVIVERDSTKHKSRYDKKLKLKKKQKNKNKKKTEQKKKKNTV